MRPADALPEDVRGAVVKGRHAASAVYLATESTVADDLSRTLLDLCATVERLAAANAQWEALAEAWGKLGKMTHNAARRATTTDQEEG